MSKFLFHAPLSLLECNLLVIPCPDRVHVPIQCDLFQLQFFFVFALVGYVEHEQTVETTTDSKNYDGV